MLTGEYGDVEGMRYALDGRRRDLTTAVRVVEVTTYADVEPVHEVVASWDDLATMEADRDDALAENERLRRAFDAADAERRENLARAGEQQARAERAEAALAVAGDELRDLVDVGQAADEKLYAMSLRVSRADSERDKAQADAATYYTEAVAAKADHQAAVRALHVLRAALHGLADAWHRNGASGVTANPRQFADRLRALLNDPQETRP